MKITLKKGGQKPMFCGGLIANCLLTARGMIRRGCIIERQECAHRVCPGPEASDLYVFGLIMKPIAQEVDRAVIKQRDPGNRMLLIPVFGYPPVSDGVRFQEINDFQGIEEIETGGRAVFHIPDAIRCYGLMIQQRVGPRKRLFIETGRVGNVVEEGSFIANVDGIRFDGVDQLGPFGK